LPRFSELASVFKENGVDDIVCMSVNDDFVMDAWKQDQEAENITVIPVGNAVFTEAMGMLVDKIEPGFGKRSWRYSMLVRDGVIVKQFIEAETESDPIEVSDADTMIDYINPYAAKTDAVSIITRPGCPPCARAKAIMKGALPAKKSTSANRPGCVQFEPLQAAKQYCSFLSVVDMPVVLKNFNSISLKNHLKQRSL
jgi:hypothetical protein